MKISNRNHLIYKDCYIVNHICFYEFDKWYGNSQCISESSIIAINPDNGASDDLKIISNDSSEVWPSTLQTGNDECWEPYNQYIIYDLTNITFLSIGFGLTASSLTTTDYQDDGLPPRLFSFGFADTSLASQDYDNDAAWTYWAVDLGNGEFEDDDSSGSRLHYVINSLWFERDTQPADTSNRFTRITHGVAEMYSSNANLWYKNNAQESYTTWTLWILDLGFSGNDGSASEIGQVATIACQNVFGLGYEGSAASFATDTGNICWGTGDAGSNCDNNVFGPPMRLFTLFAEGGTYCNGTDGKSDWLDCVNDPQVESQFLATVIDCVDDDGTDCSDYADGDGYMMSDFNCSGMFGLFLFSFLVDCF